MKCWKCGNELTTVDAPNSAQCRRCEQASISSSPASAGSAFSADIVDCYETGGGQLFLKLRIPVEAFARITINMHGKQVRVELPNAESEVS